MAEIDHDGFVAQPKCRANDVEPYPGKVRTENFELKTVI